MLKMCFLLWDYIEWKLGRKLFHYPSLHRYMPDKMYLQQFFVMTMGYRMDFRNPKTFNEKLTWLKVYDHKPEYTTLVDKYAVKEWIDKKIGNKNGRGIFTIPTIGLFNTPEEIDYSKLPNKFVIKCTHDSGSVVVCCDKAKLDINKTNALLVKSIKQDYYLLGREWPYKDVPHRIIVEELLEDNDTDDLRDYKFFCFNGKVKCFKVDIDRFTEHRANYYDRELNLLPFGEQVCPPDEERKVNFPSNIKQMICIADDIAQHIDCSFERIDFYSVKGKVYFGEITFFPGGAHNHFTNQDWDKKLGDWIELKK